MNEHRHSDVDLWIGDDERLWAIPVNPHSWAPPPYRVIRGALPPDFEPPVPETPPMAPDRPRRTAWDTR